MKTTIKSSALALLLAITSHAAQPSTFPASAAPPTDAAIANWRAKRFGMFIHWGPVSLTGKEIGWSRGKETPIEKYDNLYQQFNPTKFNADEWVSIAKAAGMRYIVLTTKHHDGFCLWDTKLTDYNIMNTPFKRDVVKELAEACMTVSAHNHWAWGGADDGVKPLEACLRMLILGNGGDGNILLNVGPTPEGIIAPEQANRLKEVGDWLAKYGESLLDTRGGPYKPTTDFACTRKDQTIYLHFLKRSGDVIKLPALPAKIVSAKLLTGGEVKISQTEAELSLTLAPKDPKEIDVIVKLELDKAAMDIAPIETTGKP